MVEFVEVASLLIIHVFHQRSKMRVRLSNWRCLGSVDKSCGQLASMVHTESFVEKFLLNLGQRLRSLGLRCGLLDGFGLGFSRRRYM